MSIMFTVLHHEFLNLTIDMHQLETVEQGNQILDLITLPYNQLTYTFSQRLWK